MCAWFYKTFAAAFKKYVSKLFTKIGERMRSFTRNFLQMKEKAGSSINNYIINYKMWKSE